MEVDKKLYEEIKEYCLLNGLKPKEYINDLLRKAFMEDKYGAKPFMANKVKVTSVVVKSNEVHANGIVYSEEALKEAVEKFKEENIEKPEEHDLQATNVAVWEENDTDTEENTENLDENLDNVSRTVVKRTIKPKR